MLEFFLWLVHFLVLFSTCISWGRLNLVSTLSCGSLLLLSKFWLFSSSYTKSPIKFLELAIKSTNSFSKFFVFIDLADLAELLRLTPWLVSNPEFIADRSGEPNLLLPSSDMSSSCFKILLTRVYPRYFSFSGVSFSFHSFRYA